MRDRSAKKLKKGDELFVEMKESMLVRLSGVRERLCVPRKPRTRKHPILKERRYMTAEEFFGVR